MPSFIQSLPNWFLAAVTTTALFLVMKIMVTGQQYEIEEAFGGVAIDFVRLVPDWIRTKDGSCTESCCWPVLDLASGQNPAASESEIDNH